MNSKVGYVYKWEEKGIKRKKFKRIKYFFYFNFNINEINI